MDKRTFTIVLVVATVFVSAWVYTYAVGNEITACVKKDGSLYVITQGTVCKGQQDTLLTWNIVGPKGDKGDTGDTGLSGSGVVGGGLVFLASSLHTEYSSVFISDSFANESEAAQVLPVGGTLSQLNVSLKGNSVDVNYSFTIMKNGQETVMACSIISPAKKCSNSVNSVAFSPNDSISIRVSGSGIVDVMRWTAKYQ